MAIRAEVFRNSAIYQVFEPETASLDQRISASDSVIMEYPSGIYTSLPGDEVALYDCTDVPQGTLIGRFRVCTIERVYSSKGNTDSRVKMMPIAAFWLSSTGTPGENVVGDVSLVTAMQNIAADLYHLSGVNVALTPVNIDGYPYETNIHTMRRSSRVINPAATTTFLELLNTILVPSEGRWRCRPDLSQPTIELGWFGDQKDIYVKCGGTPIIPYFDGKVFPAETTKTLIDDSATINSLFVEGGTWTGDKGYAGALVLWHYLNVPDGYAVRSEGYPDGLGHFRIDKLYDSAGAAYTWRRSKRVTVGSITPASTNGMTPDGTQVVAASQQLLEAGIDYLKQHCDPIYTWTVSILTSTIGAVNIGDKLYITVIDEVGNVDYNGSVFVVQRNTTWKVGGTVTNLTLSTILESLVDPLSKEYGKVTPSLRSTARQGNYTVTLVCNPNGTYTFSVPSAATPKIVNVTTNVGSATITALDAIAVSFSTTGGTGIPATVKVTFTVVPQ